MEDLVEEEASSKDAQASKPAPDIFAAALQKAGVARSVISMACFSPGNA
jgi:FMN phosphatase YigB (HAD superfamily)